MTDTNVVKNWVLKVMQQRITEGKGCMLNCALNGRKNPDGTYPKSMYINVWIDGKCECEPDDYTGKYIEVDGRFTTGDYISKKLVKQCLHLQYLQLKSEHISGIIIKVKFLRGNILWERTNIFQTLM